jgi:DNA-directed RNA polymerase subunit beta'
MGRSTVHDIYNPLTGEKIIEAGEMITEEIAALIQSLPIESVEIRSVLTCESVKEYVLNVMDGTSPPDVW